MASRVPQTANPAVGELKNIFVFAQSGGQESRPSSGARGGKAGSCAHHFFRSASGQTEKAPSASAARTEQPKSAAASSSPGRRTNRRKRVASESPDGPVPLAPPTNKPGFEPKHRERVLSGGLKIPGILLEGDAPVAAARPPLTDGTRSPAQPGRRRRLGQRWKCKSSPWRNLSGPSCRRRTERAGCS